VRNSPLLTLGKYKIMPKKIELPLYISPPNTCDYLREEQSRSLFLSPDISINSEIYEQLLSTGFRRSGTTVYKPHCEHCHACLPCRIRVADFKLSRSQKRILSKNSDLTFTPVSSAFNDEHFRLYLDYQAFKHPGGSMSEFDQTAYKQFLCQSIGRSIFYETRLGKKLVAVSVTDVFAQALSAVYTFFDPDFASRSLGTNSVLQQILTAKNHYKTYLYLGYYIQESKKMAYKQKFRPFELLINNTWQAYSKAETPASQSISTQIQTNRA